MQNRQIARTTRVLNRNVTPRKAGCARGNDHLWCDGYIRLNYIRNCSQVMKSGALLPLFIRFTGAVGPGPVVQRSKGPVDVHQLEPSFPRLQVESLDADAALRILTKGMDPRLPLLEALGTIGTLNDVRKTLLFLSGAAEGPLLHQKGPRGPAWAPAGSGTELPQPLLCIAPASNHPSTSSSKWRRRRPVWPPVHCRTPTPPSLEVVPVVRSHRQVNLFLGL